MTLAYVFNEPPLWFNAWFWFNTWSSGALYLPATDQCACSSLENSRLRVHPTKVRRLEHEAHIGKAVVRQATSSLILPGAWGGKGSRRQSQCSRPRPSQPENRNVPKLLKAYVLACKHNKEIGSRAGQQ